MAVLSELEGSEGDSFRRAQGKAAVLRELYYTPIEVARALADFNQQDSMRIKVNGSEEDHARSVV